MAIKKLVNLSKEKQSRIILAIDVKDLEKVKKILDGLKELIPAVKIGLPTLIRFSSNEIKRILEKFSEDYYFIADLKLADVQHVMNSVVDELTKIGFDGFIAHAFIGENGALKELISESKKMERDIYLVVSMSHPGSKTFIDKKTEEFVKLAKRLDVEGVVAPATRVYMIRKVRELLGKEKLILSPGIGFQGGKIGEALLNGADFEIIGRLITSSDNPIEKTKEIVEIHRKIIF